MTRLEPHQNPLRSQRATSNPYRHAAHLVVNRLRWDLTIDAWRSRRQLRRLRNRHYGEKAVVVCNGPSLLKEDLHLLQGVFTFGLNKINLLFDRHSFRPSCIVAINPFVIAQNRNFFSETAIPLFLASDARSLVRYRDGVTFLHLSEQPKFARDCSMSLAPGFTVTFVALQLAFHMGFKDVALIGCDHTFAQTGPANAVVQGGASDPSHFDSRYFANVSWQLPDLAGSEYYYSLARDTYNAFDRTVLNATTGGQLELFRRTSLAAFVRG